MSTPGDGSGSKEGGSNPGKQNEKKKHPEMITSELPTPGTCDKAKEIFSKKTDQDQDSMDNGPGQQSSGKAEVTNTNKGPGAAPPASPTEKVKPRGTSSDKSDVGAPPKGLKKGDKNQNGEAVGKPNSTSVNKSSSHGNKASAGPESRADTQGQCSDDDCGSDNNIQDSESEKEAGSEEDEPSATNVVAGGAGKTTVVAPPAASSEDEEPSEGEDSKGEESGKREGTVKPKSMETNPDEEPPAREARKSKTNPHSGESDQGSSATEKTTVPDPKPKTNRKGQSGSSLKSKDNANANDEHENNVALKSQKPPPKSPTTKSALTTTKEDPVILAKIHNSTPPLAQPGIQSVSPGPHQAIQGQQAQNIGISASQFGTQYPALPQHQSMQPPQPIPPQQQTWTPILSPTSSSLTKLLINSTFDHKALFHFMPNSSPPKSWRWSSTSYVQLPFCDEHNKWGLIMNGLGQLKTHCESGQLSQEPTKLGRLMKKIILSYNQNAGEASDFKILSMDPQFSTRLVDTLPKIVDMALELPFVLANPVPVLKADSNKTLYITKRLCASLLANAFLCTLPEQRDNMPDINFLRLFDKGTDQQKADVKKEKITCILNYFHQMHRFISNDFALPPENRVGDCILTFERRSLSKHPKWDKCSKPLVEVQVDKKGKIEDKESMLQVDFANKTVGGGVLNNGSVMEEIRFSICPELIVSRMFTPDLEDNEVLFINGSQVFSSYTGYAATFKFSAAVNQSTQERDELNRMKTEIVCMDALYYKKHEITRQFKQESIDRELLKCAVAFHSETSQAPVATGNWGCGAFHGDLELKFLIQWIAASEAGRDSMYYHTVGDKDQGKDIIKVVEHLKNNRVDVMGLYELVVGFFGTHFHCDSIFDYILHEVKQPSRSSFKGRNK